MSKWIMNQQNNCVKANFPKLIKLVEGIIKVSNVEKNQFEIPTIIFIIFYIILSPKMKRWAIITYKRDIYELPHELPNDLRLRIIGN